jgi:hypothetical protein
MRNWLSLVVVVVVLNLVLTETTLAQCEDQIRIRASVDNPTPYVGEQLIYTSRIENPTTFAPSPRTPSFKGFWLAGSLDIRREQVLGCNGTINLGVTVNEKVLFPLAPGMQEIPPVTLDFSTNPVYEASTRIVSDTVTVEVQPLPPNPPSSFTGGVGLFPLIQASLNRDTIDVGSPVRLRVALEGVGNMDQLDPPILDLPTSWRVYEQTSQSTVGIESDSRLLGGGKTFEWLLFPSETGAITIPPIVFSYFNPFIESYQTIATSPIPLTVLPGATGDMAQPVPAVVASSTSVVLDNTWKLKPTASIRPTTVTALGWWWWLLTVLAGGSVVGYRLYQRWAERRQVRRQQQQALKNARSRMANVARMKGDVAYQSFLKTLLLYFGEKWLVEPLALNEGEIQQRLLDEDVPFEVVSALQSCFVAAQQQRYAPQESTPMLPLIRETLAVLAKVDHALGAG